MKHVFCVIALWVFTICVGFGILYNGSALEDIILPYSVSDYNNYEPDAAISSHSVVEEFHVEPEFISRFEAGSVFRDKYRVAYDFESDDYLSAQDFLIILSEYDRYISNTESGAIYLLGDSNFLSDSEFHAFFDDGSRRIKREEFEHFISRIDACNNFLCDNKIISSAKQYETLIYGYYREFWDLYNLNPGGCKYWLQDMVSGSLSNARLSSILHESAHEESARLSYGYSHRSCKNHDWQVVWYDNICTIHPYNIKQRVFCKLDIKNLPSTRDILDFDIISSSVQDTIWFQTYVGRSDVISNLFSIYGMTEEFCANMIDVKFAMISDMIGYNNKTLSDDDLRPYYFWTSLICEYILALKDCDYQSYQLVLSDENLFELLRDVRDYIEYYANTIGVAYSNTWDSVALKSWYESPRIQMALSEYL